MGICPGYYCYVINPPHIKSKTTSFIRLTDMVSKLGIQNGCTMSEDSA